MEKNLQNEKWIGIKYCEKCGWTSSVVRGGPVMFMGFGGTKLEDFIKLGGKNCEGGIR